VFAKVQDTVIFQFWRDLFVEPVFRFTGSYHDVCFPFWHALQSLQSRFTQAELEEKMQDEFPFAELEALTIKIQAIESET
jgi:hypothetical protein